MSHWDEFSKSLAEPVPRRESLRRLGIALTATVLSPLGAEFAWAGRRPAPQQDPCKTFCQCRNKKQKDQCLKACNACGRNPGRLGGSCGNYFCCGAGQTSCGSYCADLAGDPDNCGACGNVCAEPGPFEYGTCLFGRCEYACFEGAEYCDGICTTLDRDADNCGACGNRCGEATPYCNQGICVSVTCPGGQTLCSGACYDLYNDSNNCGTSCDTRMACGLYETCTGGVCVPVDAP